MSWTARTVIRPPPALQTTGSEGPAPGVNSSLNLSRTAHATLPRGQTRCLRPFPVTRATPSRSSTAPWLSPTSSLTRSPAPYSSSIASLSRKAVKASQPPLSSRRCGLDRSALAWSSVRNCGSRLSSLGSGAPENGFRLRRPFVIQNRQSALSPETWLWSVRRP